MLSATIAFASSFSTPTRADITGTAHDFTVGFKTWSTTRICDTCHTPHQVNTEIPIWGWGHEVTGATFTMYSSPTLDAPIEAQPTDYSLACLSCHDGTVAVDAYNQNVGDMYIEMSDGSTYLSVDLSDDHPISIEYPATDPDLHSNISLPLHDNRVECGTCHDPHASTHPNFLRMSNSQSALCLACHVK